MKTQTELTAEEDIRGQFKEMVIYLMKAEYDEEAAESYTDTLMFGANEYHEIKSKQDKEDLAAWKDQWLKENRKYDKSQARVKELEEGIKKVLYRLDDDHSEEEMILVNILQQTL